MTLTKIKFKLIIPIISILIISALSFSPIATGVKAEVIGKIYLLEELKDSYTPESQSDGWSYYVFPTGSNNYATSEVTYEGNSLSSSQAYYTDVSTNEFGSTGYSLTSGIGPTAPSLQDDIYFVNYHDFFENQEYPRAVRINSNYNPTFDFSTTEALSLHLDQSLTYLSDGSSWYQAFFNYSNSYYLDISVQNSKASGTIISSLSYPAFYTFGDPESQMTYPFIPIEDGLQSFSIYTNDTTLLTITPHEYEYPTWFPTLEESDIFEGEFDQGEVWEKNDKIDALVEPENYLYSIRLFNLSLDEDRYYKLYTVFDMEDYKPNTPSEEPIRFLLGNSTERISGALNEDGYFFHSLSDEDVTLMMYSPGEAHGMYYVYFQEVEGPQPIPEIPLFLNQDNALEPGNYYTFTLNGSSVIKVNSTDSFDYDIYLKDGDDWISKSDETFINADWKYIPNGTYAIEIVDYTPNEEIRFTVVPVESLAGSAYAFNYHSIHAIELPVIKNRVNNINISTSDHVNQSVSYSCNFIGKYNTFISGTVSTWLGNQNNSGVWNAWPINETELGEILPTREYEIPILIIESVSAINSTATIYDYTANLQVTSGVAFDQTMTNRDFTDYDAFIASGIDGHFIPLSQISSTTEFTINDAVSEDDDHVYGIPLNLDRDSIYNISVFLIGNDSTTLNATLENNIRIMGGNLRTLGIFNSVSTINTEEYNVQSSLILTVSNVSYLYVDIERSGSSPYNNATMRVVIEKILTSSMTFDHVTPQYNDTVSNYETENTKFAKIVKPAEMRKSSAPGFEFLFTLISFTIIVFNIRRRRKA